MELTQQLPGRGIHLVPAFLLFCLDAQAGVRQRGAHGSRRRQPTGGQLVRYRALARTRWAAGVDVLPVHPSTRRLLDLADLHLPLGTLMARASIDPADVGADLHCLRRLRLVDLQQPVSSPDPTSHQAEGTPQSLERAVRAVRSVTSVKEWTNPESITSVPSGPRGEGESMSSSVHGGFPRSRRQQVAERLRRATARGHGDPNVIEYRLE